MTVGDQTTCLEISDSNGARVTGDLEVTGNIIGNVTDITYDDVTFDDIVCNTLTADGGVTVDNITIDGTEIDLSSGSLLIDVASNITLDADGGSIFLDDDGGTHTKFTGSGMTLYESSGGTDSFAISTLTNGATTIATL